jgi:hypothetical protein
MSGHNPDMAATAVDTDELMDRTGCLGHAWCSSSRPHPPDARNATRRGGEDRDLTRGGCGH